MRINSVDITPFTSPRRDFRRIKYLITSASDFNLGLETISGSVYMSGYKSIYLSIEKLINDDFIAHIFYVSDMNSWIVKGVDLTMYK